MPRRIILFIFLAAFSLISEKEVYAQTSMTATEAQAVGLINTDGLNMDLNFLCDSLCAGRATGTPGGNLAALWLCSRMKSAGALPISGSYVKSFRAKNGKIGHNVMGMVPYSGGYTSGKYVIISAHYDHLGILDGKMYPGADSNASGVVAMTALMKMFGWMKSTKRTIRSSLIFIAFDAKEVAMSGSQDVFRLIEKGILKDPVTGRAITKDRISMIVNLDQLGSTLTPVNESRPDYIAMLGNGTLPLFLRNSAVNVNKFNDTHLDLTFTYFGSKKFTELFYRFSDQRVFVDNGIPAVLFTSGITMNTNKTTDTVDTLDVEILLRRIRFIYHWLYRVS